LTALTTWENESKSSRKPPFISKNANVNILIITKKILVTPRFLCHYNIEGHSIQKNLSWVSKNLQGTGKHIVKTVNIYLFRRLAVKA